MRRRTITVFGAALLFICAPLAYLVQPWPGDDPLKAQPPAVSPERLEAHVRMLADDFVPRDFANPANLDRTAAYIRQELAQAGGTVAEQPFEAGRSTYRNVIAAFGPETRERIVIGAHYDAAGPYPAADDNASGVAGLLELARLLGADPPAIRVELVAYPLEEPPFYRTPLMGSAVHAASLKRQGVRVRVMMSLEMIGYFTDAPNSQQLPLAALRPFYPSRGNFIAVVGKMGQALMVRRIKRAMKGASPLGVHSINAPRWVPGVDFSDHMNYWDAGYPAVMITDTAFYRNPHYHTARDTADTLDYDRMAQVVQGVHAAILALA
ncbi:MAG TPA: M28 family peptidase [Longimicrobium sp.]|jgi:Zn-dependent M28 family amino/carboxypeptidase|uniref:M28 family peptidase n=1 Tax=Longimicrobium sp. TaxID=2029185 RepID=UPI002ED8DB8F